MMKGNEKSLFVLREGFARLWGEEEEGKTLGDQSPQRVALVRDIL